MPRGSIADRVELLLSEKEREVEIHSKRLKIQWTSVMSEYESTEAWLLLSLGNYKVNRALPPRQFSAF